VVAIGLVGAHARGRVSYGKQFSKGREREGRAYPALQPLGIGQEMGTNAIGASDGPSLVGESVGSRRLNLQSRWSNGRMSG
jgi:hypothetical protein